MKAACRKGVKMPKGSPELTRARREEIINACEKLYEVMSFKEVTIKEISKYTSFTRPSIYNYFSTREDIFLALLQREYEAWIRYLEAVKPTSAEKTTAGFAGMLAESLSTRPILLKLLAMNQFDMEEHSDVRCLAEFKSVCMAARKAVWHDMSPTWGLLKRKRLLMLFFLLCSVFIRIQRVQKNRRKPWSWLMFLPCKWVYMNWFIIVPPVF